MANSPTRPSSAHSACAAWIAAALIALAALVAYHNALHAPLIFDDLQVVTGNPSIRQLATALTPPRDGRGVAGRPLVNLTLALNYAASGERAWTYHITNLAIHTLAGLALFGLVRRTFLLPFLRARFGGAARPLGASVALLWTLHPLQTESVTCIAQRTEALVGLFYLGTFYCFARGWRAAAVAACALGMATKEVMATAPVLVLLFDRAFVAGTFRAAWAQRGRFYVALAATWLVLAALMLTQGGTRGSLEGAARWPTVYHYALTQCDALIRYLGLAVWPHPLVLDYDTRLVQQPGEVLRPGLLLLGLLAATVVALRRWPRGGFVGAWCFAILAPSSSFVPLLPQPVAEHRMYLPLAALVAAALALAFQCVGRRALVAALALAGALGWTTARRNHDYRTEEAIWRDTIAKQPTNARAHFHLGHALEQSGRAAEAIAAYAAAVALHSGYADAHASLGRVLGQSGRVREAVSHLEAAVAADPRHLTARLNLGLYLPPIDRAPEAVAILEALLAEQPANAQAHTWLGDALLRLQQPARAVPHYAAAVQLSPEAAEPEINWGVACLILGQYAGAQRHLERALQLAPAHLVARRNLALALLGLGRTADAAAHFEAVLRAAPDDAIAREQLAHLRGR